MLQRSMKLQMLQSASQLKDHTAFAPQQQANIAYSSSFFFAFSYSSFVIAPASSRFFELFQLVSYAFSGWLLGGGVALSVVSGASGSAGLVEGLAETAMDRHAATKLIIPEMPKRRKPESIAQTEFRFNIVFESSRP
ncbi:MAG: hypothetical protein QXN87_08865 [Candidatus Bathyarchaeia archaeon]